MRIDDSAPAGIRRHRPLPLIHEDVMQQVELSVDDRMEGGPYPERLGQPDCAYYMRTGLCRFGMTCRFNHPLNRKMVVAAARMKGAYPERIGQPECQYYLKTATCKFGATCKFHHPKEKAGLVGRVQLNDLGYPLRQNEVECAYYLRTGQCKFGSTCKFHHPQPSEIILPLSGSSIYPTVHSPSTAQHSYPGALASWSVPRASYIPSPQWQGSSDYAQMVVPFGQGLVQVPGWNAYSRESIFPERPGEPDCQFYMKTGDCKYGAVCRFHHPRERQIPIPDCMLSPFGLPLRPGEPLCAFYSRYGICKFGSNCKFDHPTTIFPYSITASSSTNIPIQSFVRSSSGTTTLPLSSQGHTNANGSISRRISLSEPRQLTSNDGTIENEG